MRAGKHWKERNKKGCARLESCVAKKYAPKTPGVLAVPLRALECDMRGRHHGLRLEARALVCTAGKLSKAKQAELRGRLERDVAYNSFVAAHEWLLGPNGVADMLLALPEETGADEDEDEDEDDEDIVVADPAPGRPHGPPAPSPPPPPSAQMLMV